MGIRQRKLWVQQKGFCYYCGIKMVLGRGARNRTRLVQIERNPRAATIDHVVPKAAGGLGTRDNIVYACLACNERKGAQPVNA